MAKIVRPKPRNPNHIRKASVVIPDKKKSAKEDWKNEDIEEIVQMYDHVVLNEIIDLPENKKLKEEIIEKVRREKQRKRALEIIKDKKEKKWPW